MALVLVSVSGSMKVEAARTPASVTVWLQVMDSCRQGLPGANFTLITPNGTGINAGPSSGTSRKTVSSGGNCPIQRGNCQKVPVGCLSWVITPPRSGTDLYTIHENSKFNASDSFFENPSGKTPFTGFVPCNGGSACRGESAAFTINSSGVISGLTTTILPDGKSATYPSGSHALGTQTDPIVFHNFQLGNGSCDGDHDADDHLTGSPSSHCDNDKDK
jgi:hypothetical protein